ncbi:hypothetical protein TKWG_17085 [Advenella kashmirensis WT001]|uniref:Uncharacterized protein n=1 Tax=Advenella kashmirensis (strain DSM 17095 / LMG 22695 / WT001) TaxID=1036672 RepID=I3UE95_ADVKW|nr:hypothetical protein TKWG_17085 [Advenella kashmirensis WT001]
MPSDHKMTNGDIMSKRYLRFTPLLWLLSPALVWANSHWPDKPVKLVVGYAAGGPVDTAADNLPNFWVIRSGNRSLSKTKPAPAVSSLQRTWQGRRQTAACCIFWPVRR